MEAIDWEEIITLFRISLVSVKSSLFAVPPNVPCFLNKNCGVSVDIMYHFLVPSSIPIESNSIDSICILAYWTSPSLAMTAWQLPYYPVALNSVNASSKFLTL